MNWNLMCLFTQIPNLFFSKFLYFCIEHQRFWLFRDFGDCGGEYTHNLYYFIISVFGETDQLIESWWIELFFRFVSAFKQKQITPTHIGIGKRIFFSNVDYLFQQFTNLNLIRKAIFSFQFIGNLHIFEIIFIF